jgi:thiol-disulfide isomerase/thioredoxin
MKIKKINTYVLVGVPIIFVVAALVWNATRPGKLDEFATCLGEQGATFYGAFWCPHCQAQKALFGNSAKKLPYVECSAPDGQTQTEICKQEGITGYPTWVFKDHSTSTGEMTLQELAEKTTCPLPQ